MRCHTHRFLRSILSGQRLAALGLLVVMMSLTACQERVIHSSWDAYRRLASGQGHASVQGGTLDRTAEAQSQNTWAVVVRTLGGERRWQTANRVMKRLRDVGLESVWVHEDTGLMQVLVGKFDSPDTPDAKRALARIRSLTSDGNVRYPNAQFTALTTTGKLITDPMNLRAYHNEYTLQIGYYDGDGREANVVKAVKSLRKQGIDAFYYDGPHRSLLTVGMFTKSQAFVTARDPVSPRGSETYVQAYSKAVRHLQDRFPYNLENGMTVKSIINGKDAGTRQSFLVRTPG